MKAFRWAIVLLWSVPALAFEWPVEARHCAVAEDTAFLANPLERSARRLGAGQALRVAVYGSSPDAAMGLGDATKAYPARMHIELKRLRPRSEVDIAVEMRRAWLAADMVKAMADGLRQRPVDLVIWQTGTSEAIRGVDAHHFGAALTEGMDLLQRQGVDLILVTPQFSPRLANLVEMGPILDYMEWIAGGHDVLLFRRHRVMAEYARAGTIDLNATDRTSQLAGAAVVHDCFGRLLAAAIAAAKPTR